MYQPFQNGKWEDWNVVKKLGAGSFGTVYEICREISGMQEQAALKVITIPQNPEEILQLEHEGYQRESISVHFQKYKDEIIHEYSVMARLKGNSNVVSCEDVRCIPHPDDIGWTIYIRMELLRPLTAMLPAACEEQTILKIAQDMCRALELCRQEKILHRDIKPQNMFVSKYGSYKLGDFGVAKLSDSTAVGTLAGTYDYMAPEIFRGKPYGAEADLYSLGIVLYWLMNGLRLPFLPGGGVVPSQAEKEQARLRRFSGEPLPPPTFGSPELKRIVLKACAFDPARRYASAGEMLRDLQAIGYAAAPAGGDSGTVPVRPPLPRPVPPAPKPGTEKKETARKRNYTWLLLLLIVSILAVAAAVLFVGGVFEPRQTPAIQDRPDGVEEMERETDTETAAAEDPRPQDAEQADPEQTAEDRPASSRKPKPEPEPVDPIHAHSWTAATCTAAETCSDCGETRGSALDHSWNPATCTAAETCSVCGESRGSAAGHSWEAATCTEAEYCLVCGESRGSAAGHSWEAATCTVAETCSVCGESRGSAAGHIWKAATCTEAEYCLVCGDTRGTVADHSWIAASCEMPKTCALCGRTEGAALAHSWKEASYDAPETCLACGDTRGEALPYPLIYCAIEEDSNPEGKTVDINPGTWTDCFGNSYLNALNFWTVQKPSLNNMEFITYRLNGDYRVLAGVIAAEKGSLASSNAVVRIYADGVLIYTSDQVRRETEPISFSVNVTDVQLLRVESYCDTSADSYCIVQAELQK